MWYVSLFRFALFLRFSFTTSNSLLSLLPGVTLHCAFIMVRATTLFGLGAAAVTALAVPTHSEFKSQCSRLRMGFNAIYCRAVRASGPLPIPRFGDIYDEEF